MIELHRLTKRFGRGTAVDDLSFTVRPGHVTGFLGPNGAGNTTTMRIILGREAPTPGRARPPRAQRARENPKGGGPPGGGPPRPGVTRWSAPAVTSRSSARFGR